MKTQIKNGNDYRRINCNKSLNGRVDDIQLYSKHLTYYGMKNVFIVYIHLPDNKGILTEVALEYWTSLNQPPFKLNDELEFIITQKQYDVKMKDYEYHLDLPHQIK